MAQSKRATRGVKRAAKRATTPSSTSEEKAKPRTSATVKVVQDLPLWNQSTRIGGGITPAFISSLIREADGGQIRRLMDFANECRQRDSHLQAVLGVSEESIAGLQWQVVAAKRVGAKTARAKDARAAAWVEEQLKANTGMHRLIAHLAGAVYYSFACVEILWRKDGGKLVPDCFAPLSARRFRYRIEDGVLVQHDPGGPDIDLQADHPNKFIFSRPRVNGDVPIREGLCRALIWMSVMRNWSIADWLKTGEMSWKPWRVGSYKKNAATSHEDREDLEAVMRRLTTDFAAVIPDSCGIKIEWPSGTALGSTHAEIVNALAQEMSKAVLGQTETTQASTTSGYAQAKVHDAVRKDMREARAKQIAADITRDLIAPMIRLNFGKSVEVPTFQFVTQDPVDLKAFSEAIVNFRKATMRIPETWLHEQAGVPLPEDGERLIGDTVAGPVPDPKAPNETPSESPNQRPPQGDPGADPNQTPDAAEPQGEPAKPQATET